MMTMEKEFSQNDVSKYNLLIVDDNAALRKTMALWLHNLYPEIQILEAENGFDAIQTCQDDSIDLILLDLKMPDLDGFEVTRCVKQFRPQTQIYLMSIYEGEAYVREAVLAGANGFFSKIRMDVDLPVVLDRFIESKESSDDN